MKRHRALKSVVVAELVVGAALVIGAVIPGGGLTSASAAAAKPMACATNQLSVRPTGFKAALGTAEIDYAVTVRSRDACDLELAGDPSWLASAVGPDVVDVHVAGPNLGSVPARPGSVHHVVAEFRQALYTVEHPVAQSKLGLASGTMAVPAKPTRYPSGSTGYDISWPQCGGSFPSEPYTVAIVGANNGSAFTTNPCFSSEVAWAGNELQVYINVNSPGALNGETDNGPCANRTDSCYAYNYGYNTANQTYRNAVAAGVAASTWWLDVEMVGPCANAFPTSSYWSCKTNLNARTIQGAINAIRAHGRHAGVYSTSYQWGVITGSYNPVGGAAPTWIPGSYANQESQDCQPTNSFGNGTPWMLQIYPYGTYDQDYAC